MKTTQQTHPSISQNPLAPGRSDEPLARGAGAAARPTSWSPRFSPRLLAGSREGLSGLSAALGGAIGSVLAIQRPKGPLPAGTTADVLGAAAAVLGQSELPADGIGVEAALNRLVHVLMEHGLDLSHPRAAAHLQPPPLSVAVVADALASVSNASLDTFDSGPSAIAVERWVIGVLVKLAKLGPQADGVLTPGGSMSNLLGLLLARDAAAWRRGVDARRQRVAALPGPIVMCSALAHFSIHRACAALGLGEAAVRLLPTDERRRIRPNVLAQMLRELDPNQTVLAIVATAGTTDFGTVDPLPEVAEIAAEHDIWMHVDAAYGFGALFSDRLAGRLAGLEHADSSTLDLHKLGWQPAAASVLLVSDTAAFTALEREVAYLNPSDDADAGYDGLLGRSLQTTRRPDAVKVAATLLAYGRRGMGEMVDACHDLARYAEQRIANEPALDLVSPAELTTVVFRYRSFQQRTGERVINVTPELEDEINGALRRRLLEGGTALIGRTQVRLAGADSPERVCLKLTLMNPTTTPDDIDGIVDAVLRAGQACERRVEESVTRSILGVPTIATSHADRQHELNPRVAADHTLPEERDRPAPSLDYPRPKEAIS